MFMSLVLFLWKVSDEDFWFDFKSCYTKEMVRGISYCESQEKKKQVSTDYKYSQIQTPWIIAKRFRNKYFINSLKFSFNTGEIRAKNFFLLWL